MNSVNFEEKVFEKMAPTPHVAVVIVGAGGVGKSAITLSFVRDRYGAAAEVPPHTCIR